ALVALAPPARPSAEPVPAVLIEGTSHGFLTLRSTDGTLLASGDQAQIARGGTLTNRLTFRFKDGSIDDSTTVFTQRGMLRLLTYHDVQKGPTFPKPIEVTADTRSGEIGRATSELQSPDQLVCRL